MAARDTKGAAGPGKGMSIGSYGEGKLPYPPDKARTKRVQSRSGNEALRRAAGRRLTEDSGQARWRDKSGKVHTGPLSSMNHGKGDTRITGAEDDRSANWTSGKTGGNVTGPLSRMTSTAGDSRKRKGQRAS